MVYHGVGRATEAEDPFRIVVSPERFESQLRLLAGRGYRFLTASELIDEHGGDRPPPPGTAVLTFDDGWRDALDTVAPLLAELGVRASFYVCTGWWDGVRHPLVDGDAGRLLDERATRELHEAGMEIGSHTVTHPDLRGLDDAGLEEELVRSKAEIEHLTGEPCRTFAYPYGLRDERVERAVAAAGYELALAWGLGPWRPLAVPRMTGPPRHGAGRLAIKLLLGVQRRD
jgi:peptidoglycan/xylan/chitin deacetylase (PgdA/CDA1 family)